jgi:PH domain
MHTFFNPDKEGWLWKQGGRIKSWKRRWFILNDNCLYYFEYTTDKEPRGIIPLENIQVREAQDRQKPHCFELHASGTEFIKACKTDSEGKVVEGKLLGSSYNSSIYVFLKKISAHCSFDLKLINLFLVFQASIRFIVCLRQLRRRRMIGLNVSGIIFKIRNNQKI